MAFDGLGDPRPKRLDHPPVDRRRDEGAFLAGEIVGGEVDVDQVAHFLQIALVGRDDRIGQPIEERVGEVGLGHQVHQPVLHAADAEELVEHVMPARRHSEQREIGGLAEVQRFLAEAPIASRIGGIGPGHLPHGLDRRLA